MAKAKFSKKEAISYGWKTTKENLWFFISVMLVIIIVNYFPSVIFNQFSENFPAFLHLILSIIVYVIQLTIQIGLTVIALKFVDHKKAKLSDLFKHYTFLVQFFLASLLFGLAVSVGLILFIIPGIIFAIRLHMYTYEVVKGAGPIEALKKSWEITRGSVFNLFLFGLLLLGINVLGAIALGVGLFLTVPTSILASAYVYKKLRG